LSSELGFTARQVIAFVVALLATSCESAGERPVEVPETPGKEVVGTAGNEGCGIPPRVEVGESAIRSLNSGGEERTYRLFLPSEYDPSEPTPLVLNLHAASATSGHQVTFSGLEDTAESEGFVLVHPEAPRRTNYLWQFADQTDVNFIADLLDLLEAELCVDPDRIFSTGMSQGGDFSTFLACQIPERIAAVASVSVLNHHDSCTRPVPMLAFVGTADPVYDIDNGLVLAVPGVPDDILPGPLVDEAAAWATTNGCKAKPMVDRFTKEIRRYQFVCSGENDLVYYVHPGGHVWPGIDAGGVWEANFGPSVSSLDANSLIWRFFAAHPAD
jgi:polyhydroxybutyrate depolymerase